MRKWGLVIVLLGGLGTQLAASEELFDTRSSDKHFNTGLTLIFEKSYDQAIREFEEAIKINPGNAKAYYFIGYSYYQKGEFRNASTAFKAAYDLDHLYSPKPPNRPTINTGSDSPSSE